MRKRTLLPMLALTTLVVLGCGLLVFRYWGSVRLRRETTYLVEPLDDQGAPDYYLAINRRFRAGVSADANAVVWLRRAVGFEDLDARWRDTYISLLGADFSTDATPHFLDWSEYSPYDEARTSSIYSDVLRRPWSKAEYPKVHEWLASCQISLQSVILASRQEFYFEPIAAECTILDARQVLRALIIRAMLQCGQGDPTAGWRDLLACHRLIQLGHSASCLSQLSPYLEVGIDAFRADQVVMQDESLSASDMETMLRDLRSVPRDTSFVTMLDFSDRCIALDGMLWDPQFRLSIRGRERAMRMLNQTVDDVVSALSKPTYCGQIEAVAKIDAAPRMAVKDDIGYFQSATGLFSFHCCPVFAFWVDYHARCAVMRELVEVGLALEAYRREAKHFPDSLAVLVPRYLDGVPIDGFDGSDLNYEREDGGYFLYSVGKNGFRDAHPGDAEEQHGDDIVIIRRLAVRPINPNDREVP